jgi:hypothetical protein
MGAKVLIFVGAAHGRDPGYLLRKFRDDGCLRLAIPG